MTSDLNLILKTNRYYDGNVEDSKVSFSLDELEKFYQEKVVGEASEAVFNKYVEQLLEDEKKAKEYLNFDITNDDSFKKYILFLAEHLEESYGLFIKDPIVYELLCKNEPVGTITNCFCTSLSELLKKYTVREIMALTRVFEDQAWKERTYAFIGSLKKEDYEYRQISYLFFEENDFVTTHHFNKIIWNDKICGSIFGMTNKKYISKVPILRSASEMIHFHYEFRIYKKYVEYIIYKNDPNRIAKFLCGETNPIDIFEPHALSEAYAWKFAIEKLLELFPFLSSIWNDRDFKLYINREEQYILSNNIIDYIRALSSVAFPKIATVTSIILRYNLLTEKYAQSTCNKAIYYNLDQEIICTTCLRENITGKISDNSL